MSQRAAWQLERLDFGEVYDFVVGKAHWLASGRPTVRSSTVARVGDHLTAPQTALVNDTVDAARKNTADRSSDLVIISSDRIVLGKVRSSDLEGAAANDTMEAIMRLGPTTIRPDQLVSDVRRRMAGREAQSIVVTKPTGELLGEFLAEGTAK